MSLILCAVESTDGNIYKAVYVDRFLNTYLCKINFYYTNIGKREKNYN